MISGHSSEKDTSCSVSRITSQISSITRKCRLPGSPTHHVIYTYPGMIREHYFSDIRTSVITYKATSLIRPNSSIFGPLIKPAVTEAEMLQLKKLSVIGCRSLATNRSLVLMPNVHLSMVTVGREDLQRTRTNAITSQLISPYSF